MLLQFNSRLNEAFITVVFYISSRAFFLLSEFHSSIKLKWRHYVVLHSLSFSLQTQQSYASYYIAMKTLVIFWFDSLNKDWFNFLSFRRLRQWCFSLIKLLLLKKKNKKKGIFQHHETVAMLEQILIPSPIIQINIVVRKCFLIRKPLDLMETTLNLKDKKYFRKI